MANQTITQLPTANALTGTELVPIVQDGGTVKTTVADIANAPTLTFSFLTATSEAGLPDSRLLSTPGNGLTLTDNGAGSTLALALSGAPASLITSGTGLQVKTGAATLTARTFTYSGNGLSVTNGDGIAGNPTISLAGYAAQVAGLTTGAGLVVRTSGGGAQVVTLEGVADQITIADGSGASNPQIGIASNPTLPGTGSVRVPSGTTGQRTALPSAGAMRFNTSLAQFEGYNGSAWGSLGGGGGGGGNVAIQLDGALIGSEPALNLITGTDVVLTPVDDPANSRVNITPSLVNTAVTAASYGSASQVAQFTVDAKGRLTAASNTSIAISASQITSGTLPVVQGGTNISGYAIGDTLYASGNTTLSKLTIGSVNQVMTSTGAAPQWVNGSTLSVGTATNLAGGAAGSIPYQTGSGATSMLAAGSGVLVGGSTPSYSNSPSLTGTNFSGIPNAALSNSAVTIGTTSIALGATSLTLGGLTTVSVTQDPSTAFELTTKQYVDGLVSTGLTYHQPVQAATTQDLATQTGGTVIYNNGASGVGATITLSVALTTLDGYSLANTNRILVKDEINQAYNGIYTWATGGLVLTRATDADSYGTGTGDLSLNDYFFVQNGTVNKGTSYVLTTVGTITFGTTAITFAEFSTSQVYTGTSPIQVSGTVISLNTVPVDFGGTNITSYTAGDLIYATAATTLNKLTVGASGAYLSSSGTAPQWSAAAALTKTDDTNVTLTLGGSPSTALLNAASLTLGWAGELATGRGGTGVSSYNAGDLLYYASGTTLSKLAIGSNTYILTSSGSAPQWSIPSGITVGTATNAVNVGITDDATTNATMYPVWVTTNTGNLPTKVTSTKLSFNPSTGILTATGGVAGGTF